jgi:hypothetical protein
VPATRTEIPSAEATDETEIGIGNGTRNASASATEIGRRRGMSIAARRRKWSDLLIKTASTVNAPTDIVLQIPTKIEDAILGSEMIEKTTNEMTKRGRRIGETVIVTEREIDAIVTVIDATRTATGQVDGRKNERRTRKKTRTSLVTERGANVCVSGTETRKGIKIGMNANDRGLNEAIATA